MSEEQSGEIACSTIVARAVDPDQLTAAMPRRVRKSAFLPRMNGKDNEGLSVTEVVPGTLRLLREKLDAPQKQAVTLHTGSVREISAGVHKIDIVPDPQNDDPHHALITGFPPRHPGESEAEKAVCNRLAELLAAHARCCLEP